MTCEAARERDELALRFGVRLGRLRGLEHALDAARVDDVERQRASAESVDALGAVALAEARRAYAWRILTQGSGPSRRRSANSPTCSPFVFASARTPSTLRRAYAARSVGKSLASVERLPGASEHASSRALGRGRSAPWHDRRGRRASCRCSAWAASRARDRSARGDRGAPWPSPNAGRRTARSELASCAASPRARRPRAARGGSCRGRARQRCRDTT